MTRKESGRKRLLPKFETLSRHLFEGIEKNHEGFVRIAGLWAEI
jgi:hypothetical protein